MIERVKGSLAVKVFLLTFLIVASCCGVTYLSIVYFAPYIYTHDAAEAEELADMLAFTLADLPAEEVPYFIEDYAEILRQQCDDEYVFHLFESSGRELALPRLDAYTGGQIGDYRDPDRTVVHSVSIAGRQGDCTVLLTKNTDKESQAALALQRAWPVLAVVMASVSIVVALFYARYMTRPIQELSRLSMKMAALDFSGLCTVNRSDEIGVLSQSLHDLSEKLAAALSQLREANQRLQADIDMERQMERQRAAFFAAASHELKTPITIIKGQLEGMLYQVGRYKDRETYLAQSLEVTGRLENMVQELLTLSRLDAPGYAFVPASVRLDELLHDRLAAHEDLFMQRELTLEAERFPEADVSGDARLLQKAVDNLLENAAAYSPAGERIVVRLRQTDGKANLTIENTGAHIPEADIPRLFEAFYRVDPSRNRETGGTGLGLYIVKTILDLHGAKTEIQNTHQGVRVSVQI